jgi:hypothetical protein
MEQKMSVFSAKKVEKSQEQLQIKAAILASYSQVGVPHYKALPAALWNRNNF